jgi:hypothetical protein
MQNARASYNPYELLNYAFSSCVDTMASIKSRGRVKAVKCKDISVCVTEKKIEV